MSQRFYASPSDTFTFSNGAVGYRPAGPFDRFGPSCDGLGPFAKVTSCPIGNTNYRLTCYATGYADTFFSVPACTRIRGKYVKGFFTQDEDGVKFNPNHY